MSVGPLVGFTNDAVLIIKSRLNLLQCDVNPHPGADFCSNKRLQVLGVEVPQTSWITFLGDSNHSGIRSPGKPAAVKALRLLHRRAVLVQKAMLEKGRDNTGPTKSGMQPMDIYIYIYIWIYIYIYTIFIYSTVSSGGYKGVRGDDQKALDGCPKM